MSKDLKPKKRFFLTGIFACQSCNTPLKLKWAWKSKRIVADDFSYGVAICAGCIGSRKEARNYLNGRPYKMVDRNSK
jgi:hypothetical protein